MTLAKSPFLTQLLADIEGEKSRYLDTKAFIEKEKLTEYKLNSLVIDDLPRQAIFGTVFAIKNNTIVEFTSGLIYRITDLGHSDRGTEVWECIIQFRSLTMEDINEYSTVNDNFGKDDIVTRDYGRSSEFLISLLRNKFKLYLKP